MAPADIWCAIILHTVHTINIYIFQFFFFLFVLIVVKNVIICTGAYGKSTSHGGFFPSRQSSLRFFVNFYFSLLSREFSPRWSTFYCYFLFVFSYDFAHGLLNSRYNGVRCSHNGCMDCFVWHMSYARGLWFAASLRNRIENELWQYLRYSINWWGPDWIFRSHAKVTNCRR